MGCERCKDINGWSGPGCTECEGGSDDPDPPGIDDAEKSGATGADHKSIIATGSDSGILKESGNTSAHGEHSGSSAPAKPEAKEINYCAHSYLEPKRVQDCVSDEEDLVVRFRDGHTKHHIGDFGYYVELVKTYKRNVVGKALMTQHNTYIDIIKYARETAVDIEMKRLRDEAVRGMADENSMWYGSDEIQCLVDYIDTHYPNVKKVV